MPVASVAVKPHKACVRVAEIDKILGVFCASPSLATIDITLPDGRRGKKPRLVSHEKRWARRRAEQLGLSSEDTSTYVTVTKPARWKMPLDPPEPRYAAEDARLVEENCQAEARMQAYRDAHPWIRWCRYCGHSRDASCECRRFRD